ncbi:superoxide dismutase family protein [Chitinasiproducens palmae]|uniref:Superoxide dismutase, Cu-Zn family n=1 Tax=Chitinasiproducens palmae TaxID=1770053 RepID=A0A1H2PPV5_9BURK|nr:superoxide dismutase family protein [Chitinasiproducens palmae]SDV47991.1 superoxide dismutase, Cu-Zn family [Chitinasiproducens palmae]
MRLQARLRQVTGVGGFGAAGCAGLLLSGCALFGSHPHEAEARLWPTADARVYGRIALAEGADGLQISYDVRGLAPNSVHGMHIHETGLCSGPGASDAGPHFDREGTAGAATAAQPDTASGDLPNIRADSSGVAIGVVVTRRLALDGVRSVLGRAVTVDREAAGMTAGATASAAEHIACGVIGT